MDCCYICFEGTEVAPLIQPCKCSSYVHKKCMYRWCMQSIGKKEEFQCRLCGVDLPDWRVIYRIPKEEFPYLRKKDLQLLIYPDTTFVELLDVVTREIGVKAIEANDIAFRITDPYDNNCYYTVTGCSGFEAFHLCVRVRDALRARKDNKEL